MSCYFCDQTIRADGKVMIGGVSDVVNKLHVCYPCVGVTYDECRYKTSIDMKSYIKSWWYAERMCDDRLLTSIRQNWRNDFWHRRSNINFLVKRTRQRLRLKNM